MFDFFDKVLEIFLRHFEKPGNEKRNLVAYVMGTINLKGIV